MQDTDTWTKAYHMDRFMTIHFTGKSKATRACYTHHLKRFVRYLCDGWNVRAEDLDLSRFAVLVLQSRQVAIEIQPSTIQQFLDGLSSDCVRRFAASVLNVYFDFLVRNGLIRRNPVVVNPAWKSRVPKTVLPDKELSRFFDTLRLCPIYEYVPVALQFAAGLRVSELCALRTDDVQIDSAGGQVLIRREAMKGTYAAVRPLPELADICVRYAAWRESLRGNGTEFFFVTPQGKPLTAYWLNGVVQKVGMDAECSRKVTSHDLRHGYGRIMKQQNISDDVLALLLRHAPRSARASWEYGGEPTAEEVSKYMAVLPCSTLADAFARKLISVDITTNQSDC